MADGNVRIVGAKKDLVSVHLEKLRTLAKSLRRNQSQVQAGWFETARYVAGKQMNGQDIPKSQIGVPIAKIARIQNFGATIKRGNATIRIPPRPFMQLASKNFLKDRAKNQTPIARALVNGKITPDQALKQIAVQLETCIVEAIKNGGWQSNSASTIKKKGFDAPLRDSAQMWQTVVGKVNP